MSVGYNGTTENSLTRVFAEMSGAEQWTSCIWAFPNIAATSTFYSLTNNVAAPFLWEAALTLTGTVVINVETAGAAVTTGTTGAGVVANGSWHHLAQVYDGKGSADADKIKLYINSTNTALTFSGATANSTLDSLSAAMYLASRQDGTQPYAGFLFNLQMWDIPLTASEVEQSRLSIVPPRADRLRYWATLISKDDAVVYTGSPLTATQLTHSTSTANGGDAITAIKPSAQIPYWNTRRGMKGASRTRRNAQKTVPFSPYPGFHKGM